MRNIDNEVVNMVQQGDSGTLGNTVVKYSVVLARSEVYLHGHLIAKYSHTDRGLLVCFQGYVTNVTKNRINALLKGLGYETQFKVVKGELTKTYLGEKIGTVSSNDWLQVTK